MQNLVRFFMPKLNSRQKMPLKLNPRSRTG